MGKSYKDKYKRNNTYDKRNKRINQRKPKNKFDADTFNPNKVIIWDDEILN